ncbi:MAG: HEAT repeat domain-containing protein [Pseudomonadota bacterium]
MTTRRRADFSLAEAIRLPSFTPRQSDAAELIDIMGNGSSDEIVAAAARALVRLGAGAVAAVSAALHAGASPAGSPPGRIRLIEVVGRIAAGCDDGRGGDRRHLAVLATCLADENPAIRRAAVIALGKTRHVESEEALLALWQREERADVRRWIVESLGNAGGERALCCLAAARTADVYLAKSLERALLKLRRTLNRSAESRIVVEARAPNHLPVCLHCRSGLEKVLVAELAAVTTAVSEPRVVRPGVVRAQLDGTLEQLFLARTMLWFGFELPAERGEVAPAMAAALSSPRAQQVFKTWSAGPVRYRIAWAHGGHRRALVWQCAELVARSNPMLVNDPVASTWEVVVTDREDRIECEARPRKLADPRFAYRQALIPAASHPTIAAALARIAGAREDDVVWDPFLGSGTELIERGLAGPFRSLHGSDTDPEALAAARQNLAAARLDASLAVADATLRSLPGTTLVITNPPMGRRVHRGDVGPLLDRFVGHVASVLVTGGRMVWVSPLPDRTREAARRAGLGETFRQSVDMGGFNGEIQAFCRRDGRNTP